MTILTDNNQRAGCFLASEANKTRSRTQGVLASGQNLLAGTVLGLVAIGAATSAVKASGANTGNGTMGSITAGVNAKTGVYTLRVKTAATNAGAFEVANPHGDVVGEGTVGTAFSGGGLSFTLADGSTDFVAGDGFDITVAAGSGKYTALDTAATTGAEFAAGILFDSVNASGGDLPCVVVDSDAEVNLSELIFPVGITTANQNAAIASLKALGIKFPPNY